MSFMRVYWNLQPYLDDDFMLLCFFSYILDVYDILDGNKIIDNLEYKRLSDTFIQSRIDITSPTIRKYLEKLENKGFIKIDSNERIKGKKVRYIYLVNEKVNEIVNEIVNEKNFQQNILTDQHTNSTTIQMDAANASPSSSTILTNESLPSGDYEGNNYKPPTAEEARNYALAKGLGKKEFFEQIDWQYFVDYYDTQNWKDKQGKQLNWRQKVVSWVHNQQPNKERSNRKSNACKGKSNEVVQYSVSNLDRRHTFTPIDL